MVLGWTLTIHWQTKHFGRPFAAWVEKVYISQPLLRTQLGTSFGMRRKFFHDGENECFEDLLNPVKATPTDTFNMIDFGKEKVFTLTGVQYDD